NDPRFRAPYAEHLCKKWNAEHPTRRAALVQLVRVWQYAPEAGGLGPPRRASLFRGAGPRVPLPAASPSAGAGKLPFPSARVERRRRCGRAALVVPRTDVALALAVERHDDPLLRIVADHVRRPSEARLEVHGPIPREALHDARVLVERARLRPEDGRVE